MKINCFGDSLTAGTAFGNTLSYPQKLRQLTGLEVNNYGIGGENSLTIAARIGALPLTAYMDNCVDGKMYSVRLRTSDGRAPELLRQVQDDTGNDLVNPVTIKGISGTLSRQGDMLFFAPDGGFIRTPCEAEISTCLSALDFSNDINIFWAGTNDYTSMSNVGQVMGNICAMIDFCGSEKYLVLGLTALEYMPEVDEVNEVLSKKFGGRFLNFRSYLLENIMTIEDVKLDREDIKMLQQGDIPYCLIKAPQYDHVHGNEQFFDLLGRCVYDKLQELGYLNV